MSCDELAHPQWRAWRHCRGDHPGPRERYLNTIYQSNCLEDLDGPDVVNSADLSTAYRPG